MKLTENRRNFTVCCQKEEKITSKKGKEEKKGFTKKFITMNIQKLATMMTATSASPSPTPSTKQPQLFATS